MKRSNVRTRIVKWFALPVVLLVSSLGVFSAGQFYPSKSFNSGWAATNPIGLAVQSTTNYQFTTVGLPSGPIIVDWAWSSPVGGHYVVIVGSDPFNNMNRVYYFQ